MRDTPHDAVSDCDIIASNKARIGCVELLLDMGEEGAPLSMTNLSVPLSLPCSVIKAEENDGVGRNQLTPCLHYPVNQTGLLPVRWIIVAFLDADGAKDGSELLHLSALEANNGQLAHLSSIATCFPNTPAWQADSILIPLRVAVVQQDSKGLGSPMYLEVRNLHYSGVGWTTSTGVSHFLL